MVFSTGYLQYQCFRGVPSETGLGGAALPTHFNMKSIYAEVTLVNPSSLPMIYDIYDIVARKDIPNGTTLPSPNLMLQVR